MSIDKRERRERERGEKEREERKREREERKRERGEKERERRKERVRNGDKCGATYVSRQTNEKAD